jgi:hypothetical protein
MSKQCSQHAPAHQPPTTPTANQTMRLQLKGVHFGWMQGNRNCTGRNARHCALLPRVLLCAIQPSNTFTILPIMSQRFQGANQEFMLQQIVKIVGSNSRQPLEHIPQCLPAQQPIDENGYMLATASNTTCCIKQLM